MDETAMRDRVVSLVAEIVEIDDPSTIAGDDRLREDLGMDSLMSLELISTLSEQLRIDIEVEQAMEISTVDQACAFAAEQYAAQRPAAEAGRA